MTEGITEILAQQGLHFAALIYAAVLAVYDWKNMAIPKKPAIAMLSAALAAGCWKVAAGYSSALEIFLALIPGIFLILTAFFTKEKVGYGDGIVFITLGSLVGIEVVFPALMCSLFLTAIVSCVWLVMKKADFKTRIPLIPFAAVSLLVVEIWQKGGAV